MNVRDRIIVAGVEQSANLLEGDTVGAIVTMMPASEYEHEPLWFNDTQKMRKYIKAKNIPQYFSRVFNSNTDKWHQTGKTYKEIKKLARQEDKREIHETVHKIDDFINTLPEGKKLLIHCAAGEDRSATGLLLYLVYKYGGFNYIHDAFTDLYKICPKAPAYQAVYCFEALFGKFEKSERTARLYTATIINSNDLHEHVTPTKFISGKNTSYIFNFAGLSVEKRKDALEQMNFYNRAAPRFGMPLFAYTC